MRAGRAVHVHGRGEHAPGGAADRDGGEHEFAEGEGLALEYRAPVLLQHAGGDGPPDLPAFHGVEARHRAPVARVAEDAARAERPLPHLAAPRAPGHEPARGEVGRRPADHVLGGQGRGRQARVADRGGDVLRRDARAPVGVAHAVGRAGVAPAAQLAVREEGRAEADSGVVRHGRYVDVGEDPGSQQPPVRRAVQRHAAGQHQPVGPGTAAGEPGQFHQDVLQRRLYRGGEGRVRHRFVPVAFRIGVIVLPEVFVQEVVQLEIVLGRAAARCGRAGEGVAVLHGHQRYVLVRTPIGGEPHQFPGVPHRESGPLGGDGIEVAERQAGVPVPDDLDLSGGAPRQGGGPALAAAVEHENRRVLESARPQRARGVRHVVRHEPGGRPSPAAVRQQPLMESRGVEGRPLHLAEQGNVPAHGGFGHVREGDVRGSQTGVDGLSRSLVECPLSSAQPFLFHHHDQFAVLQQARRRIMGSGIDAEYVHRSPLPRIAPRSGWPVLTAPGYRSRRPVRPSLTGTSPAVTLTLGQDRDNSRSPAGTPSHH